MILLGNVMRYCDVALTLLSIAMLLRLSWLRVQRHEPHMWSGSANLFTIGGLCVLLGTGVFRRLDTIGSPPDRYLWSATVGVTLLAIGLLRAASWRRDEVPTRRGKP